MVEIRVIPPIPNAAGSEALAAAMAGLADLYRQHLAEFRCAAHARPGTVTISGRPEAGITSTPTAVCCADFHARLAAELGRLRRLPVSAPTPERTGEETVVVEAGESHAIARAVAALIARRTAQVGKPAGPPGTAEMPCQP